MTRSDTPQRSDCPISFALEIFGDRWTLIVLRDLMLHARKRYRDLQACDEGIATNVLADRLKRLEHRNLIRKERDPDDARQFIYQPTELGVSLVPMLVEMIAWVMKSGNGASDASFLHRFDCERETLITDMQQKIREEAGL